MPDPQKIIFLVGPTAVGKSEYAHQLVKEKNGEIVNADAMQVYRGLDIASDKPTWQIQQEYHYHVVDVVDVSDVFDVAQYRQLAQAAIDDILKRDKTPIVVGGSGMYVSVLLDGIFQDKASDETVRQRLLQEANEHGAPALHERLRSCDEKAALKIHPNDTKRIVRALEVIETTGKPISQLQVNRQGLWGQYPLDIIGLIRARDVLYQRVEARVEAMFQHGLVEEIRRVIQQPLSKTSATLIGVPEVAGYIRGEHDLERAKYLMKLHTRHLVKRQLTWFRRDSRIQWVEL